MDEGKLGEQMARASRAAQLVNDEAFNDAVNRLKERLIDLWKMSKDDERDLRERLWLQVSLIDQIRQALIITVRDGKEAQRQLDELSSDPRPQYLA